MPLAPALLSTTTGCFVCSVIDWPSARASWSVALPAAKGTTKLNGLAGKPCAAARPGSTRARPKAAVATRRRRGREGVIALVSWMVRWWKSSARPDEVPGQFGRHLDDQFEQQVRQRLAVAVEVQGVVDAAVQHVVDDEVHRLQPGQQVARHCGGPPVCELACHRGLRDLLDEQRPERRVP